jgi:hypothetical protein
MTRQPAQPAGLPFSIDWLPEPVLGFAGDLTHIDPKVGIAAAAPAPSVTTGTRPSSPAPSSAPQN